MGLSGRILGTHEEQPRVCTIPPRQRLPFTRRLVLRRWRATHTRVIVIIIIIIIIINIIIIIVITYCYGDRGSSSLILLWHLGAKNAKANETAKKKRKNSERNRFVGDSNPGLSGSLLDMTAPYTNHLSVDVVREWTRIGRQRTHTNESWLKAY